MKKILLILIIAVILFCAGGVWAAWNGSGWNSNRWGGQQWGRQGWSTSSTSNSWQ